MATHHTIETVDARSTLLAAEARAAEIPESADAYGWLVGSWELDVRHYWGIDVSARGLKGEAHFGWALEGRAIQDVWIMPRRCGTHADWSDRHEHVRDHAARLGSVDPGVADHVDQSRRATTTSGRSVGGSARTSSRSARDPMARRRAGPSRRSRKTHSIGRARRWIRTAGPGGWKASSARRERARHPPWHHDRITVPNGLCRRRSSGFAN